MRPGVLMAASLALLAAPFDIRSATAAESGPWEAECRTDAMTDKRHCSVNYVWRDRSGYVRVSAGKPDGKWMFTVSPTRNMGIIEGCALRVDTTPAVTSELVFQGICVFVSRNADTAGMMSGLKAGKSLLVRATFYGRGHTDFVVPLDGFKGALIKAGW